MIENINEKIEKTGFTIVNGNINNLEIHGYYQTRNDVVSSDSSYQGATHIANTNEFSFHTDGTFLKKPPAIIGIQVLEQETEAVITLLNSRDFGKIIPDSTFQFGLGKAKIASKICDSCGLVRYRRDYMSGSEKALSKLESFNHAINSKLRKHHIELESIKTNQIILIDNWKVMHKRASFTGLRVIRRAWFDKIDK